jgi:hypothetical protein
MLANAHTKWPQRSHPADRLANGVRRGQPIIVHMDEPLRLNN